MKQQNQQELCRLIRARLGDVNPNANIFSTDEILCFIDIAIAEMRSLFSYDFTIENINNPNITIKGLVIDYAVIVALASKALIEKGREFTLSDNGITASSPEVSKMIMEQYATEYSHFMEKVRLAGR